MVHHGLLMELAVTLPSAFGAPGSVCHCPCLTPAKASEKTRLEAVPQVFAQTDYPIFQEPETIHVQMVEHSTIVTNVHRLFVWLMHTPLHIHTVHM